MESIEQTVIVARLLLTSFLIGCTGALVMLTILWMGGDPLISEEALALGGSAFVGASIGGLSMAWAFGRERKRGFLYAILGGIGSTLIGAFVAAILYFGWYERETIEEVLSLSLIAPVMIFALTVTSPAGLFWLSGMLSAHVAARQLRRSAQF